MEFYLPCPVSRALLLLMHFCSFCRLLTAVELVVGVFELMGLFGLVGKEH
jgi:hypothetical protein